MATYLLSDTQTPQWVFKSLAAVAATTITAYVINKRHFAPIPGTSGPSPEFLIGNLRNFFAKHKDVVSIWKGVQHYGPFVALWFGPTRVILVSDPEITADIVKNKDYQIESNAQEAFAQVIPYSMPSIVGDMWKRHRRALTPILGNQRLKFLITKMDKITNATINSIKEQIQKTDEPIDVKDYFEDMALDTMGYLAFGRPFNDIDGDDLSCSPQIDLSAMKKSFEVLSKDILARIVGFNFYKFIDDSQKLRDAKNEITKVVSIIANEYEVNHQKMMEKKLEQSEWESFMDRSFIAQVLSSKDGHDFTFDELRGEMTIMISAGAETTSATMCYAIKLLSEYPEVQEKLYEEIITAIGKDAVPQYEQLQESAMPYLDKVIKEIQRLSLLISNVVRSSTKEVTIKNVVFPKGTSFWLAVSQMHRDPKHWKDPLVFLPERWNEDGIANGGPVNPKAFMPFGGGLRICYGMKLATLELKFFLVYLTRAFFFKELPLHLKDRVGEEEIDQQTVAKLVNTVALPVPRQ